MAKRKKKTTDEGEETAETHQEEHQQQLIDHAKERQKEHLDKLNEKLDSDEDASAEIAALQESNLQIQRLKAGAVPIPSGQSRSGLGAAGTCVVGPEDHAFIEAKGGETTDDLAGHASIHNIGNPPGTEVPAEEPEGEEGETEEEQVA